jgi:hypothetical protein
MERSKTLYLGEEEPDGFDKRRGRLGGFGG